MPRSRSLLVALAMTACSELPGSTAAALVCDDAEVCVDLNLPQPKPLFRLGRDQIPILVVLPEAPGKRTVVYLHLLRGYSCTPQCKGFELVGEPMKLVVTGGFSRVRLDPKRLGLKNGVFVVKVDVVILKVTRVTIRNETKDWSPRFRVKEESL